MAGKISGQGVGNRFGYFEEALCQRRTYKRRVRTHEKRFVGLEKGKHERKMFDTKWPQWQLAADVDVVVTILLL
jgi:hypothetical protein